jgi:hypothetical protein
MEQNNETSLVKDYFGFDTKTVLTFLGLVTLVIVVVTFIYVSIFGFDNWKTSMSQAGSMMLANFDPQAATPLDNRGELVTPAVPNATPAAGAGIQQPGGGQYNCPACGAVGLPVWNAQGSPICPTCGGVMSLMSAW